jgi:hypothetical protein
MKHETSVWVDPIVPCRQQPADLGVGLVQESTREADGMAGAATKH